MPGVRVPPLVPLRGRAAAIPTVGLPPVARPTEGEHRLAPRPAAPHRAPQPGCGGSHNMWVSTTAQNSALPGGREHLWVRRVEPIEDRRVDVLACTRTYTAPWMRAQRRLAKPGPGATRPRRAARGRVDAHTGTSLVKTPRAIHPRRDGVARGGAWPAARAPDTRIAPARRAAMDRAPGRADRRSRLLSTPRSPPGPAPGVRPRGPSLAA